MRILIFSVRDVQSEVFAQPWFSPQIGSAIRAFTDAVNDPEHHFNAHPEDYEFYKIGEWNEDGKLEGHKPVKLGAGSDFLKAKDINNNMAKAVLETSDNNKG